MTDRSKNLDWLRDRHAMIDGFPSSTGPYAPAHGSPSNVSDEIRARAYEQARQRDLELLRGLLLERSGFLLAALVHRRQT